ncbi:YpoC family protein [Peribacillus kribbensis]|uniref:YpoC family protein n=1 Tax=Peribacillus kribbensis TaxID=356658 RepID=UPI0012DDF879|nr:hypothetical protein [Peribacillus kribbensis]
MKFTTPVFLTNQTLKEQHLDLLPDQMDRWNPALLDFFYFPYESCFYSGINCFQPWRDFTVIHDVLFLWKEQKSGLSDLFRQRNRREALPLMKKGIALYVSAFFWLNNSPVHLFKWKDKAGGFERIPMNGMERLEFVLHTPGHYQSLAQLSELFTELEKILFKHMAIKKASRML